MTATWHQWLTDAGADFGQLRIVYSPTKDGAYCPGWGDHEPAAEIGIDHPVLYEAFDDGYGAPEAPMLVAWDKSRAYFPVKYDGATWCESVLRDPAGYLGATDLPYPGGG